MQGGFISADKIARGEKPASAPKEDANIVAKRMTMDKYWANLLRSPKEQRRDAVENMVRKHVERAAAIKALREKNQEDLDNMLNFIHDQRNEDLLKEFQYVAREDGSINLTITDETGRKSLVVVYPRLSIEDKDMPVVEVALKRARIMLGRFKDTMAWKVAKFLRETNSKKTKALVERLMADGVVKKNMRLMVVPQPAPSTPAEYEEVNDDTT